MTSPTAEAVTALVDVASRCQSILIGTIDQWAGAFGSVMMIVVFFALILRAPISGSKKR